jgi:two-component system OmpR family sensor kinase
LIPLLMVLGRVIVRRTFQPMRLLTADLDHRSDDDLQPIPDEKLPSEIRPFVVAINRLLARVDHAMLVQRRFVADAAHELRTPLTALSLQAERLQSADMSDSAKERLSTLRNGITRSQRLVVQLLTLARAQDQPVAALQPVSIQTVFRQVLEDTMPLAERKQIDIGVAGHADAMVLASEADLATLVKNLVGNAIRHTPVFGRIDLDVRVDSDTSVIQVSDTGPGIPPQERERVFEPFYRNLETGDSGSGLGLSIVKAIADRLGARIVLTFTDEALQTGLCVQVIVPKRQPRS